jgi:hypothetical protein
LALVNMFSELRKYRVGFAVSFPVGAEDASYIELEFNGHFEQIDLLQLENHRIYIKLMMTAPRPSRSAPEPLERLCMRKYFCAIGVA